MTLIQTIQQRIAEAGDSPYLLAPGRPPLTYARLAGHIETTVRQLASHGLAQGDRIGLVLANGPEQGTAMLAVTSFTTAVPLNPAFTEAELTAYLPDLRLKALLCDAATAPKLKGVCERFGLMLLPFLVDPAESAGIFQLPETPPGSVEMPVGAETTRATEQATLTSAEPTILPTPGPQDIAAVFMTSGTSARPKLVPLSHEKILSAAHSIVSWCRLTDSDRTINAVSFFHIQGFVSVLTATALSGGSLVCLPSYEPEPFFRALAEFRPTGFTAGPAAHQALLRYAKGHGLFPGPVKLRYLRSSAAPLKPELIADLERLYGAPLLEAYGLTETATGVIGNPLPPGVRKTGSVGLPLSCEARIVDENGTDVPTGALGQILLRGPSVFDGYEEDGRIVPTLLPGGWLATGDLGWMDADGYFFIAGRSKEMINRGGQKIIPREVDEALLELPQVRDAACFALPHPRLGEIAACAVVRQPDTQLTAEDVRDFLLKRLAAYKVPARTLFVEAIPRTANGKVQRAQLAGRMQAALRENPDFSAVLPRTPTEEGLAAIWRRLLELEEVGVQEDFVALGGDSLAASLLAAEIEAAFGCVFPASFILGANTVEKIARLIDTREDSPAALVPLRPGGTKPPLYVLHYLYGEVLGLEELLPAVDPDFPLYAVCFTNLYRSLKKSGAPALSLPEIAARYADEIQNRPASGPVFLLGHSFGGLLAQELARQLQQRGCAVGFTGLFDTRNLAYVAKIPRLRRWQVLSGDCVRAVRKWCALKRSSQALLHDRNNRPVPLRRWPAYFRAECRNWGKPPATAVPPVRRLKEEMEEVLLAAARSHVPQPQAGTLTVFRATGIQTESRYFFRDPDCLGWAGLADSVEMFDVPGGHSDMVNAPHAAVLSACLNERLRRAAT